MQLNEKELEKYKNLNSKLFPDLGRIAELLES